MPQGTAAQHRGPTQGSRLPGEGGGNLRALLEGVKPRASIQDLHHLQVQKFPSTTVTFDDFLKVLIEVTESYLTHSYSLLQRKDSD